MFGIDSKYTVGHQRLVLTVVLQNCKKTAVKHSIKKPIFCTFMNLSAIIYPRMWTSFLVSEYTGLLQCSLKLAVFFQKF